MINLKGIGSPRARNLHQRIITGTAYNMFPEIVFGQGLDLLCEGLVTENPYDNYPDIIIKDRTGYPLFIMEITRSWSLSYDKRKCLKLKKRFPTADFYVFNYETDVLYFLSEGGIWLKSDDYDFVSPLFSKPVYEYIYLASLL